MAVVDRDPACRGICSRFFILRVFLQYKHTEYQIGYGQTDKKISPIFFR